MTNQIFQRAHEAMAAERAKWTIHRDIDSNWVSSKERPNLPAFSSIETDNVCEIWVSRRCLLAALAVLREPSEEVRAAIWQAIEDRGKPDAYLIWQAAIDALCAEGK